MSTTVYRATAYRTAAIRDGRWWAVVIHGLPPRYCGVTQGRDLADAERMAREAIASLLDVPESEVGIDLRVLGVRRVHRLLRTRATGSRHVPKTPGKHPVPKKVTRE